MWKFIVSLVLVLGAGATAIAQETRDVVSRVVDGDTIAIKTKSGEVHLRLKDVDAPELEQPGGKEAKEFLEGLLKGKEVTWNMDEKDAHGRYLSTVKVGRGDVSEELLKEGHAWVYRKYTQEERLLKMEKEARKSKKGLWAGTGVVAPWDWRQSK